MDKPHSPDDEAIALEAADVASLIAENASLRDRYLRALADAEGRLAVRVTPGTRVEALEIAEGRLTAKVRAKPEDGKANAALEKLVAGTLGVPGRDVSVVSGMTSRIKTVAVAGDPGLLAARAAAATRSRG